MMLRVRKTGRNIVRIGVTGGIGSGKSLVCKLLESLGIPLLSADEIAKQLTENDVAIRRKIEKAFGAESYARNGALNRSFIAQRIFSNPKSKNLINKIVHPAVEREIDRRTAELESKGARVAVIEAALIYEAGLDKKLDAVVVVDADREMRIRRVMQRDGTSEEEVERRMNAQWSVEKKARRADFVLVNNGTIKELEKKVMFLKKIIDHIVRGDL